MAVGRKGNIPDLSFRDVVGRDPVGKTIAVQMAAAHPDWSDEQITARINQEYDHPVIAVAEVARWRPVAR